MPPSERMRILSHRDTTLAMFMAQDMAQQIGIRPIKISALATAVSELTTNVIKYANNGLVTVQQIEQGNRKGIEVIVEDRGPGITDIETAMKDHVSSSGTLGLGLPGTQRMVDEFEITSLSGQGTKVRIVVWI